MESDFSTALTLLIIGMLTVFVVLTLVVLTGNLLTSFVNKYLEEPKSPLTPVNSDIGNNKIAAITAAVEAFTAGKGRIQKIEKL